MSLTEFPRIDEDLLNELERRYPLTDSILQQTEWQRAFLAGQRDIIRRLRIEYERQQEINMKSTHRRQ
jgi:hypothetical protein